MQVTDVAEALKAREEDIRKSFDSPDASIEKAIGSQHSLWTGPMAQRTREAFLSSPIFILLDFRYAFPASRRYSIQYKKYQGEP